MPSLRPKSEARIEVGEPMLVDGKEIYPVARVSTFRLGHSILTGSSVPLALVIIERGEPGEQGRAYAVIFEEDLTLDQILDLAPSLRPAVDEALGIHRIGVS